MLPTYYRGCWHVVSRSLFIRYRHYSSLIKEVYNPKVFILHAASLCQAFAHCTKFLAAASRRSMGRVSVPLWLTILSDQLPIKALVGRYLTNQLIRHKPLPKRPDRVGTLVIRPYPHHNMQHYLQFPRAILHLGAGYLCITHPFATIPLLLKGPCDLHA